MPITADYMMRRSYYFIAWFSIQSNVLWAVNGWGISTRNAKERSVSQKEYEAKKKQNFIAKCIFEFLGLFHDEAADLVKSCVYLEWLKRLFFVMFFITMYIYKNFWQVICLGDKQKLSVTLNKNI